MLIPLCVTQFDAIPEGKALEYGAFSRIAACLAKSAAAPYSALAAPIKVPHVSYQNAAHKFYKLIALFLTRTVYKYDW